MKLKLTVIEKSIGEKLELFCGNEPFNAVRRMMDENVDYIPIEYCECVFTQSQLKLRLMASGAEEVYSWVNVESAKIDPSNLLELKLKDGDIVHIIKS